MVHGFLYLAAMAMIMNFFMEDETMATLSNAACSDNLSTGCVRTACSQLVDKLIVHGLLIDKLQDC